jgi:hypothetical protein
LKWGIGQHESQHSPGQIRKVREQWAIQPFLFKAQTQITGCLPFFCEEAMTIEQQLREGVSWLLYYEDLEHAIEVFTDRDAAHARFTEAKLAWNCDLFVIESEHHKHECD